MTTPALPNASPRSYRLELGYDASEKALAQTQQLKPNGNGAALAGLTLPLARALHLDGGGAVPPGTAPTPPEHVVSEGGVLEWTEGSDGLESPLRNEWRLGASAFAESYTQVRDDLLEWRQYVQKRALKLPMESNELQNVADALDGLTRKGIAVDDADPLVKVDPVHNQFTYRRYIQGQPRRVTVTGVPPRSDLVRESVRVETARRLGLEERRALAANADGIAKVHRAREVNGRAELGDLALSETSAGGINALLDLLDRLPVTNRAQVNLANGRPVLVDGDLDGSGHRDRFSSRCNSPQVKSSNGSA